MPFSLCPLCVCYVFYLYWHTPLGHNQKKTLYQNHSHPLRLISNILSFHFQQPAVISSYFICITQHLPYITICHALFLIFILCCQHTSKLYKFDTQFIHLWHLMSYTFAHSISTYYMIILKEYSWPQNSTVLNSARPLTMLFFSNSKYSQRLVESTDTEGWL